MARRGAGAPPPKSGRGGGSNDKPLYHLSEAVKGSDDAPRPKMVKALKLRPGTKNQPILTLDDFAKMDDAYSINIHMFNLRGTKDNIVVCPKTAEDPRPCPLCEVLNKDPSWYACLTGIDRNKYVFDKKDRVTGQMGKITYTDLRRLILVTQTWTQRMDVNADRAKGWRGSHFEVSRSEPITETRNGIESTSFKDSPRIGDVWYFTEKYDDEKMKAEFEKAAATYGIPVEQFVQSLDYDVLLKAKSHEELVRIANDIRNDGSAVKVGAASPAGAAAATGGDTTNPEAEINY